VLDAADEELAVGVGGRAELDYERPLRRERRFVASRARRIASSRSSSMEHLVDSGFVAVRKETKIPRKPQPEGPRPHSVN
jgi:hypothetical protein